MRFSLSKLFQFVIAITQKHNIDESHSLGHSMRVFQFAEQIAREEPFYILNPDALKEHQPIIRAAAILHDTCDKKYRLESDGLVEIGEFLGPMMPANQITATLSIIEHMSYSKVKVRGMPNLGKYQMAFNVVREADLLDAYDFDRSMIYHMQRNSKSIEDAYKNAEQLFENRVLKHVEDGYLTTKFAISSHPVLAQNAIIRMRHWKQAVDFSP